MDFGIPAEVRGQYGEYYSTIITGLESVELFRCIIGHGNQKLEATVPIESFRYTSSNMISFEPAVGMEVDVAIGSSDSSNLKSWWPATVLKIKGDFVAVDIILPNNLTSIAPTTTDQQKDSVVNADGHLVLPFGSIISKAEIVERDQIRPRNCHPNFTKSKIYKHEIFIPTDYQVYCHDSRNFDIFTKRCGSSVLMCLAPENSIRKGIVTGSETSSTSNSIKTLADPDLVVEDAEEKNLDNVLALWILSTNINTIKSAKTIENMFIEMLKNKVRLVKENEELLKRLEEIRINKSLYAFVEEFSVPSHLVDKVLQNNNMRKAQDLPNITSIQMNRATSVIRICGSSQDAVSKARSLLEFNSESILIPNVYVSKVKGRPQHLQTLVDRVQLGSIRIIPYNDRFAHFNLVGTKNAIEDMKLVFNYHIDGLREIDRLRGAEEPPLPTEEEINSLVNSVSDIDYKTDKQIKSPDGDNNNQCNEDGELIDPHKAEKNSRAKGKNRNNDNDNASFNDGSLKAKPVRSKSFFSQNKAKGLGHDSDNGVQSSQVIDGSKTTKSNNRQTYPNNQNRAQPKKSSKPINGHAA